MGYKYKNGFYNPPEWAGTGTGAAPMIAKQG